MRARLGNLGAPTRLAAFAALLALVGGAAALVGAATGGGSVKVDAHGGGAMAHMSAADANRASGLASVAGGYTFVADQPTRPLDRTAPFRFRILDSNGRASHDFDLDGGVRLHLIVVRRDFAGYQHVHPAPQRDGSWSIPLRLAQPGVYRAFADFEVNGQKTVLGHDLFVAGRFAPTRMPGASTTATADGYAVTLAHDALRAGKTTTLHFDVTRDGRSVPAFETYVGHRGHLVALRDGDLQYSHVHPLEGGGAGRIDFETELSAAGSYRLFLQFKIQGVVHTAAFTVEVAR